MGFERSHLPDPLAYFESQGLIPTGRGKWRTAACTFHGGSDSMRINLDTGGYVCMAGCGASGGDVLAYHMDAHGLEFVEAAKDLGAWVEDGKPNTQHKPTPISARAALQVLTEESNLVAIAAAGLADGKVLAKDDLVRLLLAANRIARVSEVFA